MTKTLKTATLKDLLETIQDAIRVYGEDAPAVFACDYGDYGHTQQALAIEGDFELLPIEESCYSASGFAVVEEEEEEEEWDEEEEEQEQEQELQHVVVIR